MPIRVQCVKTGYVSILSRYAVKSAFARLGRVLTIVSSKLNYPMVPR